MTSENVNGWGPIEVIRTEEAQKMCNKVYYLVIYQNKLFDGNNYLMDLLSKLKTLGLSTSTGGEIFLSALF